MHTQRQIDYLQAQCASEWLEVLKLGRADDVTAFHEWCRKSPLHIREFLEITCTDRALEQSDLGRAESPEELIELLKVVSATNHTALLSPDSEMSDAKKLEPKLHLRRYWAIAAAVTALCLGVTLSLESWFSEQEFSTKIGEQRTVELQDSSVITLNTDSDIKVLFEDNVRSLELRRGEAVFKVAHDPARPFLVRTRAGTVQAVGTEFNVYDRPEGADVTVLEGRVRLTALRDNGSGVATVQELAAGERARIATNGGIQRIQDANIERVTAWSKRRLKFHNESLQDIVLEFNRYHRGLKLRVDDIPAGSRHYSGIFDADDPETLAKFLEREPDLTVERTAGEIIIRRKTAGSARVE